MTLTRPTGPLGGRGATAAMTPMLGNRTADDRKVGLAVFHEVFGLPAEQETDPTKGGLF